MFFFQDASTSSKRDDLHWPAANLFDGVIGGGSFFFDGVTGKEKQGDDGFVNGYVSNLDVIISLVTK